MARCMAAGATGNGCRFKSNLQNNRRILRLRFGLRLIKSAQVQRSAQDACMN
jgi:hypothetical protein